MKNDSYNSVNKYNDKTTEKLKVELKLNLNMGNLFCRGSGETTQMKFSGKGFVIVCSSLIL